MNSSVHPATRILAPGLGGLIFAGALAVTDSARIAGGTVILLTIAGVAAWSIVHTSVRPMGEIQLTSIAAAVSAPFALAASRASVVVFALFFAAPNRNLRKLPDLPALARAGEGQTLRTS